MIGNIIFGVLCGVLALGSVVAGFYNPWHFVGAILFGGMSWSLFADASREDLDN